MNGLKSILKSLKILKLGLKVENVNTLNSKCYFIAYAIIPTWKRILFPHYICVGLRQVIFLSKQNISANGKHWKRQHGFPVNMLLSLIRPAMYQTETDLLAQSWVWRLQEIRVGASLWQWRAFVSLGVCSLNASAQHLYMEPWSPVW